MFEISSNKTTQYLLPILGYFYNNLSNAGIENAYLGYSTTDDYGEYIYLHFQPENETEKLKLANLKGYIIQHPKFVKYVEEDDRHLLVQFQLTEHEKKHIIQPFIEGKYSQIDKEYVNSNYSQHVKLHNGIVVSDVCYYVLTKADILKEYMESYLGTTLPEGAELASIPDKIYEVFYTSEITDYEIPIKNGTKKL